MVRSSTSASDTLMSPATTSPLSSTLSRTSTRPVDRCPSVSGVGIGQLFYGFLERSLVDVVGEGPADLSNAGAARALRAIWVWKQNDASKPVGGHTSSVAKYYSDKNSSGVSTSLSAGINSATGKPSNPKPYRARQMDVDAARAVRQSITESPTSTVRSADT